MNVVEFMQECQKLVDRVTVSCAEAATGCKILKVVREKNLYANEAEFQIKVRFPITEQLPDEPIVR